MKKAVQLLLVLCVCVWRAQVVRQCAGCCLLTWHCGALPRPTSKQAVKTLTQLALLLLLLLLPPPLLLPLQKRLAREAREKGRLEKLAAKVGSCLLINQHRQGRPAATILLCACTHYTRFSIGIVC
jgi:hypothetical protein